jgi:hypothetical protein
VVDEEDQTLIHEGGKEPRSAMTLRGTESAYDLVFHFCSAASHSWSSSSCAASTAAAAPAGGGSARARAREGKRNRSEHTASWSASAAAAFGAHSQPARPDASAWLPCGRREGTAASGFSLRRRKRSRRRELGRQ